MTNLNDHFERIFILNLPYKPDRRERVERQLRKLRLARKVEWMRAYSGDMMPHPAWWRAGNGAWGCLLSHARVMEEAIMDRLESYLVLEDDVVWQDRAGEMLESFMRGVPEDWDQIYLGGQHLREPVAVGNAEVKMKNEETGVSGQGASRAEPSSFSVLHSSFPLRVLRAWNVNRTHAFALRRKAMVKVHQHIWHAPDYISKSGGWHIDHQLGLAHERGDWSVYAPDWWLAGQDADSSNISGRYNPRLWWHPSRHAKGLPFIHLPVGATEKSLGPAGQYLHPGNTLKAGTLEDAGLEPSENDDAKLRDWLAMIAREALDMHRLPAWQSAAISPDKVAAHWPAGLRPLEGGDLKALCNYPWNGLLG
jgi:GR25 family glycosyltransferase involved in LPS biosynthesis